ncbi:MAG: hypothetical protein Q9192_008140 [Flavoplaca navasiana]
MAWRWLFSIREANTCTAWGYTFKVTDSHLTKDDTARMKMEYDRLGEAALDRLEFCFSPQASIQQNFQTFNKLAGEGVQQSYPQLPKKDMYVLLREYAPKDEVLGQLWAESNEIPPWVCWEQIERGQQVFYRYGGPALTGLAFQSLLGGMGATRIVETLTRTGGFSTSVARHRLLFVIPPPVLKDLQPGGAGHASSIRVRLLHAAVRQRIIKLAQEKPGYYSVKECGIPISDLDAISTIISFSCILIWLSFPRQGIWLRRREIEDYIALFRYIAYLMGTPHEFFATPERAKMMMETLLRDEISPSATSRILANNILNSLEGQPPTFASRSFLEANCRWLNGNELCDELGLGRPSLYYWMLMSFQVVLSMAICYFYRSIPMLDQRKIAALRRVMWSVIVEDKQGLGQESVFE